MSKPRNELEGSSTLPVRKTKCATCPFLDGVAEEFACLKAVLAASALIEASRICHNTGKPPEICRGSRDVQLAYFAAIGFIEAPTDEAWNKKWSEIFAR